MTTIEKILIAGVVAALTLLFTECADAGYYNTGGPYCDQHRVVPDLERFREGLARSGDERHALSDRRHSLEVSFGLGLHQHPDRVQLFEALAILVEPPE